MKGTTSALTLHAPAKVNLFLDVLNRRPDGFHDIYSLFQAVSLSDTLTFSVSERPGIELIVKGDSLVPASEENLVARAYRAIKEETGLTRGVRVELEKRIPIAAGLGGGSSDAATALSGINRLFDLGLSRHDLIRLGAGIGSDVPFFFSSGQALVSGRGDVISEIYLPLDYYMIIVTPPVPSYTAEAYRALGRGLTGSPDPDSFHVCSTLQEFVNSLKSRQNDFEPVLTARLPELNDIFDRLLAAEASMVRMSGSGPTLFGLFLTDPAPKLPSLLGHLPGARLSIVRPVRMDWQGEV